MVDRLVAVDTGDYRLPDPVLAALAADVADDGSAVGAAVADATEAAIESSTYLPTAFVTPSADRLAADRADQAYRALSTFRHAVELRNTTPVNVWCIGDSITLGVSPANATTRWASILRDRLRKYFPSTSNPVGGYGFYSASAGQNSPVVITDGLAVSQGTAAFSPDSYTWRAYGPGDKQVYTITGTGADILYWNTATAQGTGFKWSVDAGSTTNVVTDSAYAGPQRVMVRGLTAGVHTITVEWAVGANPDTTYYSGIAGIVAYNGDENEGWRVLAGGIAGGTSGTWNAMTTGPFEIAKLYAPDLVVIPLGTNDYGGTVPVAVATYKANLQSIITKIKARTTGKVPSFVIAFPAEIYKATPLSPFSAYRAAVYEIAAADPDNVTVFDWGTRFNPVPTFNSTLGGLLHTDYVHPTALGHSYIAGMLARFLPTGQSAG